MKKMHKKQTPANPQEPVMMENIVCLRKEVRRLLKKLLFLRLVCDQVALINEVRSLNHVGDG
jgi:hypothetical protein